MRRRAPESRKGGLTASEASREGIGSGVVRAQNLASGKAVSQETVNRMHAFFSRHEKNKHGPKGEVAWALWGGDAGKAWADAHAVSKDEKIKQAMYLAFEDELEKIAFGKVVFKSVRPGFMARAVGRVATNTGQGVAQVGRGIASQVAQDVGHLGIRPLSPDQLAMGKAMMGSTEAATEGAKMVAGGVANRMKNLVRYPMLGIQNGIQNAASFMNTPTGNLIQQAGVAL